MSADCQHISFVARHSQLHSDGHGKNHARICILAQGLLQTIQHGLRLTISDQDSHDLSSIFTFVTQAKIGGRMLLRPTRQSVNFYRAHQLQDKPHDFLFYSA